MKKGIYCGRCDYRIGNVEDERSESGYTCGNCLLKDSIDLATIEKVCDECCPVGAGMLALFRRSEDGEYCLMTERAHPCPTAPTPIEAFRKLAEEIEDDE